MEAQKNKQILTTVIVLAAVAIVVGGTVLFSKKSPQNTSLATDNTPLDSTTPAAQNTSTPSGSSSRTTTSTTSSSGYKDGTYSTTADYYTPEDTDTIKVTLAVKDGVVSGVTATTTTGSRESRQYDSAFLNAYKSYVVGKRLSGLSLNRVSGASLTTNGFNDALDMIRQQAKT